MQSSSVGLVELKMIHTLKDYTLDYLGFNIQLSMTSGMFQDILIISCQLCSKC